MTRTASPVLRRHRGSERPRTQPRSQRVGGGPRWCQAPRGAAGGTPLQLLARGHPRPPTCGRQALQALADPGLVDGDHGDQVLRAGAQVVQLRGRGASLHHHLRRSRWGGAQGAGGRRPHPAPTPRRLGALRPQVGAPHPALLPPRRCPGCASLQPRLHRVTSHLPGDAALGRLPHDQVLEGCLRGWGPGEVDAGGGHPGHDQVGDGGKGVQGRGSRCWCNWEGAGCQGLSGQLASAALPAPPGGHCRKDRCPRVFRGESRWEWVQRVPCPSARSGRAGPTEAAARGTDPARASPPPTHLGPLAGSCPGPSGR